MSGFKRDRKHCSAIRSFALILLSILALASLFACRKASSSKQDLNKGVVEFDGRRYTQAPYEFQINESYSGENGLNPEIFTRLAEINGTGVYSVKGLDTKDWIYFPFGNCDVGFGLCKNEETSLDGSYYDFLDTFQLIKHKYTVEEGFQKTINATINDRAMVTYAYRIASSDGNLELKVTSDKLTQYSLLLTPKAYPALKYIVSYYECDEGYFIPSNKSKKTMLYTKVDNTIHKMINSLNH